jgi:Holliday junction resolvasome RuvABC ATP-dependent DNA helicase subunit
LTTMLPAVNKEQDKYKNISILGGAKNNQSFKALSTQLFKEPQDETKSIRQRALEFFSNIIGNDDIKENVYRVLLREDRIINILLVGPPATSKTLMCKVIEDKCNNVIFYDAASGSTGAGLIEILRRNLNTKILIIDEISEMKGKDLEVLRGLLNDGRVSKTLKSQLINFKMKNLKVFATTNNPTKLSLPLKSRFQMYMINGYNDEEFVQVLKFCLVKQNVIRNEQLAEELAYAMLQYEIKNIRTALSICSLVHESDTHEDIKRIIDNYIANDASKININYNETE